MWFLRELLAAMPEVGLQKAQIFQINPYQTKQVCSLSHWFLNLLPNQAWAARLGLLVLVGIRKTISRQLWTHLKQGATHTVPAILVPLGTLVNQDIIEYSVLKFNISDRENSIQNIALTEKARGERVKVASTLHAKIPWIIQRILYTSNIDFSMSRKMDGCQKVLDYDRFITYPSLPEATKWLPLNQRWIFSAKSLWCSNVQQCARLIFRFFNSLKP